MIFRRGSTKLKVATIRAELENAPPLPLRLEVTAEQVGAVELLEALGVSVEVRGNRDDGAVPARAAIGFGHWSAPAYIALRVLPDGRLVRA